MILTKEQVQKDIDALPANYKTKDKDRLIKSYVKSKADVSDLRDHILKEQQFHRIYYYVNLMQINDPMERVMFIDQNMFLSDWWHTDELIRFVADAEFVEVLPFAEKYMQSSDPFVRRWGYVLFISKLGRNRAEELLPFIRDDEAYPVQMGEAWLISELAVFEPQKVYEWFKGNSLAYSINGKAIQKICDSYRVSDVWKERFKGLRKDLKKK